MPTVELMGWNKRQRRWAKKYKGKVWFVSPRQLHTEPTKDASRQAANEWWEKKQAEIDGVQGSTKEHPPHVIAEYRYALENHRRYAKWQRKYGSLEEAQKSEACMEWLQAALKTDSPPFPLTKWQEDPLWEAKLDPVAWHVWLERMTQIKREEKAEQATPPENTIKTHVDDYLLFRKALVGAGKNKLGSYDTIRTRLNVFRQWLDPFAPLENLNESLWERFYVYLSGLVGSGKMSGATMAGTLGAARAFIRSRWERRFIELPRNLNSRILAASVPVQEIVVFTRQEIIHLLEAASERKRLYLLLMLNCGFYPVDIAALKHGEVDWKTGRISRQRSKTRGRSPKVPKVDYLLWRETFKLLREYRSDHPDLVLVNSNGSPLWTEVEKDGKFNRNNSNRSQSGKE